MSRRRRRSPAVVCLAAWLAVAACSGGDGESGSATTERRSSTTTTTEAATATAAPATTVAPSTTAPPATLREAASPEQARALILPNQVVVPVFGLGPGGWLVHTPCDGTATVNHGRPIAAATVVLDPGHGGTESGAVGPNGLTEKELNLVVTRHAQAALEREGVDVLLTRTGDYRVTLKTRAEIAKQVEADAFVSIHHNAEPDGPSEKPGTETYYQLASAESKRLAGLLYEETFRTMSQYDAPWMSDTDAGTKYRTNDRGGDFYGILRQSAGVPAALAEIAFINAPEVELLSRPDVQQAEGEAVARGVLRFLRTQDPGSGFVTPYDRPSPGPGRTGGASGCIDPPL